MFKQGIFIEWLNSIEYIDLDIGNLDINTSIESTKEYWQEERKWIDYITSSSVKNITDSIFEITIDYSIDNNPHLSDDDAPMGTSKIILDKSMFSGTAEWFGNKNKEHDGKVKWHRIDTPLISKKKRVTTTKQQREQAKFRKLQLAVDNCCALTSEKTPEALEAAHIISASNGGIETINNGILLRSDLHKLYDSNKFEISTCGKVVNIKENDISSAYVKLLANATIPDTVTPRVSDAIKKRNLLTTSNHS
jgi:hypothetical protein